MEWGIGCILAIGLVACESPEVVAKVGDTTVTRADLALYVQARADERPIEQSLEGLVDRALMAEGARRAGLLKDPQVAARVEAARREVLANAYLDREASQPVTFEALRKRYEAQRETLARTQVHVAHIVVRLSPDADARARTEAQARINNIYARVVSGEDFAAVARQASEDAATGARGGDLGPIREGQVDPRFFSAVSDLKVGTVSQPFETAFGLHVARALEPPQKVVPSFEEVRGQLAAQARHEAAEALMKRLREDISVKRYPERLSGLSEQRKSDGEESR
ncbi:peptidylprolyl isomerase [Hyalangium gracile]|uniref:peptidylprolyl isomerase n=1 Tax=Hyalangium gracile TaxID=394092 RepID=UPI001CCB96DB|nr:peptidylprolyl isomerase [Hyalangium gracile]